MANESERRSTINRSQSRSLQTTQLIMYRTEHRLLESFISLGLMRIRPVRLLNFKRPRFPPFRRAPVFSRKTGRTYRLLMYRTENRLLESFISPSLMRIRQVRLLDLTQFHLVMYTCLPGHIENLQLAFSSYRSGDRKLVESSWVRV